MTAFSRLFFTALVSTIKTLVGLAAVVEDGGEGDEEEEEEEEEDAETAVGDKNSRESEEWKISSTSLHLLRIERATERWRVTETRP